MMENMLKHIKRMFGWHGGMGDPPPDNAIIAIIRGVEEWNIKSCCDPLTEKCGEDHAASEPDPEDG